MLWCAEFNTPLSWARSAEGTKPMHCEVTAGSSQEWRHPLLKLEHLRQLTCDLSFKRVGGDLVCFSQSEIG
jgi:hypothetical protein